MSNCKCGCKECAEIRDSLSQIESQRDIAEAMVVVLEADVANLKEDLAMLRTERANESA